MPSPSSTGHSSSYKDVEGARMILSKLERGWTASGVRRVECELSKEVNEGEGDEDESDEDEGSLLECVDVVKVAELRTPTQLVLSAVRSSMKWPSLLEAGLRQPDPGYNLTHLELPFPYAKFPRLKKLTLIQVWLVQEHPLHQCFPLLEELSFDPSIFDYSLELPDSAPAVDFLRAIVPKLRILRLNASAAEDGLPFSLLAEFLTQGLKLESLQVSRPALPLDTSPQPTSSNLPSLREFYIAVKQDFGGESMPGGTTRKHLYEGECPWDVCREVLRIRGVQKLAIEPWWERQDGDYDPGWLMGEMEGARDELQALGTTVEVKSPDAPCFDREGELGPRSLALHCSIHVV